MKQSKAELLPLVFLGLSAAGALARWLLYLTAVDEKGLLIRGHFWQWLLWILCAAAVVAVLPILKQKGSNLYAHNFGPSISAALGSAFMALAVLLTVLEGNAMPRSMLVLLWYASGILSVVALIHCAFSLKNGAIPFVANYGVLCLFLAMHMVSRYQPWSGVPQAQNWVFSLLGVIGLTLCGYHRSAFSAGSGHRRAYLITHLLTLFCCCAALPHTDYFWLYLGGVLWSGTGLCRITPVPETEERA